MIINPYIVTPAANAVWDGLTGYWTADNVATDSVGSNNGTLINGATYATGKINNGFSLDGADDYVDYGLNKWSFTEFTVEGWFKPTSFSGFRSIIQNFNYDGTNFYGWQLLQFGDGMLFAMFDGTSGGGSDTLNVSGFLTINTLHHYAITKASGGNMKLYIDGVLVGTKVTTNNPVYHPTTNYSTIGNQKQSSGNFYHFSGVIDETGIFGSTVKTAGEITTLYNSGNGRQHPS